MNRNSIDITLERTRNIFRCFSKLETATENMKVVMAYLENTHPEFRPAAYEAVAMSLALKDLQKSNEPLRWKAFMEGPGIHYSQPVHSGLGYAIGKAGLPVKSLLHVEHLMRPRVLSGYGYYDGMVRASSSVKNKKIPSALDKQTSVWYDQGLGTSLWVIAGGNISKIHGQICTFNGPRKPALWKGVGYASSFMGGCDEHMLNQLLSAAGEHSRYLATGAAMAARTRVLSGTVTRDLELACRLWWNLSAQELSKLSEALLPVSTAEGIYDEWHEALSRKFMQQDLVGQ
jgi:hypothetical protein